GAQPDLAQRVLARHVEDLVSAGRHGLGELHEQRRFPDPRIAADQHQRAGHDAAAQHAAELAEGQGQSLEATGGDLRQPPRHADLRLADRPRSAAAWRGLHTLDQRVPLAALGAAAEPLQRPRAALLADVDHARLVHGESYLGRVEPRAVPGAPPYTALSLRGSGLRRLRQRRLFGLRRHHQVVALEVDEHRVAGLEATLEQRLGQRVFDQVLDRATHRSRAIGRIVTLLHQEVLGAVGHVDLHLLLRQLGADPLEQQVDDLADVVLGERAEDHAGVDAVEELGLEEVL